MFSVYSYFHSAHFLPKIEIFELNSSYEWFFQILQASVMGQPQSISGNQPHAQSHQIQSQQPTQALMNGNVPVQPPLMLQKIQPSSTPQQPQQSTQYLMPNVNLDPRTVRMQKFSFIMSLNSNSRIIN